MQQNITVSIKKYLCIVLLLVCGYLILRYAAGAIFPFVFGLAVAVFIRKAVRFIEKATGLNSKISGAVCLTVCYVILFTSVFFAVRFLLNELYHFFEHFPAFYENSLSPVISRLYQYINELQGSDVLGNILKNLFDTIEKQTLDFSAYVSAKVAAWAAGAALYIPEMFITVTVTVVASFFICVDYDKIIAFILAQVSPKNRNKLIKFKRIFCDSVWKLCGCYLFIFLITFSELFLGLFLLGIKWPAAVALIISLTDILPLLGTGTVLIPWSVIALINKNPPLALGLFVLYLIITVVRNIIEPKIIGNKMGLHPLITLAAMYMGLKFGGAFMAMVLPLILMILKLLNDNQIICLYRKSRFSQ